MRREQGYFCPDLDRSGIAAAIDTRADVEAWLGHVHGREVVVQGGGHLGLIPSALASIFNRVYTAEPDGGNFECLRLNCRDANVIALECAWGARGGTIDMARDRPENSGTHYVRDGSGISLLPIDALALERCNLIALDVEGYEYYAILGAMRTMRRCKPVIVWENKRGQAERHRIPEGATAELLSLLGYQFSERVKLDEVWLPPSS